MAFNPNGMTQVTLSNGVKMPQLGVGGNTPGIIKYPFWQMCVRNPHATCVRASLTRAAARQCRERYAHPARRSGYRG